MSTLKSIAYTLKEVKYNPLEIAHLLIYGTFTATYLRALDYLLKPNFKWFRNHMTHTYHGKVVPLDEASRIISINKDIECRDLDQVLPYKHAIDIILKNPQNILANECPCRALKKDSCKPSDVCLVIGEPFVDLRKLVHPFGSRRISPDEALKILKEEDERGHVHTVYFKTTMLNRFFVICNCCKCCCKGRKFMADYDMQMVLPSGYRAVTGDNCVGCGECEKYCPFDAIEVISFSDNGKEKKKYQVIPEKCFGCGICESKCKKENITLILDPEKGIPLKIEELAKVNEEVGVES